MAASHSPAILHLPEEMLTLTFAQLEIKSLGPRLGRLCVPGRTAIATPHYIASASRGIVPHVSHDVFHKHTQIRATYNALEDFIEKTPQKPPILQTPVRTDESRLRKYSALPDDCVSILGPRRVPSIPCPAQNTSTAISVSTSVGFRQLEVEDYIEATEKLKPDIVVSIADIITAERSSVKRIERSADRTHAWLRDSLGARDPHTQVSPSLFSSIPSLEKEQQSFYLSDLADEYRPQISGLSIYEPTTVDTLPVALSGLPRLCLADPASPHAVLDAITIGVDMITVPFVTRCSEYGISLSFAFPGPSGLSDQPLGFDMWSPEHATDLSPLAPNCKCYTCTRHHRAYVHHLLQAKEMLAWTLLQVHNFATMDAFFRSVRTSIASATFIEDQKRFTCAYSTDMPATTGVGPRIRGYQTKSSGGGELKKNPKGYNRLDETMQKLAEADLNAATPAGDAKELQAHGLADQTGR